MLAEQKYMEKGNKSLFSLFQDQCSPEVTTKMGGSAGYKLVEADKDGIKLLRII